MDMMDIVDFMDIMDIVNIDGYKRGKARWLAVTLPLAKTTYISHCHIYSAKSSNATGPFLPLRF